MTTSPSVNYGQTIEATEMDALRRSARISRMDRIRNEEIRKQMKQNETIIKGIERP